jgi:hypothetical protein
MQVKAAKQVFPNMRKNARSEPKLTNPRARADSQPATVSENEPEPAMQTKIAVSANSNAEKEALPDQSPVVTEGIRIDEGGPAAVPPDIAEKEHSEPEHVKVDFFAKRLPRILDEVIEGLEEFRADCEKAMVSNGPRIPASSPNAAST